MSAFARLPTYYGAIPKTDMYKIVAKLSNFLESNKFFCHFLLKIFI